MKNKRRLTASILALSLFGSVFSAQAATTQDVYNSPFSRGATVPSNVSVAPRMTVDSIQMVDFAGTSKKSGLVYAERQESDFGHYYFLPSGFNLVKGTERDRINAPDGKSRLYVIPVDMALEGGKINDVHQRLLRAFREIGVNPSEGSTGSQPTSQPYIHYAVRIPEQKGFNWRSALLSADYNGKRLIVIEKTPKGSEQMLDAFAEIERTISNDVYDYDSIQSVYDSSVSYNDAGVYFQLPENLDIYLPDTQFAAVQGAKTVSFRYFPRTRAYYTADQLPFLRVEWMDQRNEDDDAAVYAQKRAEYIAQVIGIDKDLQWQYYENLHDYGVTSKTKGFWLGTGTDSAKTQNFVSRIMYYEDQTGSHYALILSNWPSQTKSTALTSAQQNAINLESTAHISFEDRK